MKIALIAVAVVLGVLGLIYLGVWLGVRALIWSFENFFKSQSGRKP